MRFHPYIVFAICGISGSLAQDASTTTLDGAVLSSQAEALISMFPNATPFTIAFQTPGGNLVRPEPSVVAAIITGVPPTIIAKLALPAARSSLASEFKAGNTPAWYQALPDSVKDYVKSMNSQVKAGAVNLSATPTEVSTMTDSGSSGKNAAASSTSEGFAPHITGEVSAGIMGALGVLGIALIL
ncbi:hypothetical protein FE257_003619 [Aspergillus nanangensis]|uniref:Uncharacterized protein n=1 Tax=Aspergillus nanangensis TaxID=2582783 RepID=A0AAD4CSH4_ASPNN|nr:hypothetical protein FE257_003619 [Aspergillus nanangensis]